MTKLFAFDLDRTLVYGPDAERFYSQYPPALNMAFARAMNIPLAEASACLDGFRRDFNGRGELAFDVYRLPSESLYDALCEVEPRGTIMPKPESVSLLKSIAEHARILLITNEPVMQAARILEAANIPLDVFMEVIAWERGAEKPKSGGTQVFERVLHGYELLPEEMVMVGDTLEEDILPAEQLGIATVHIGNGDRSIPDITCFPIARFITDKVAGTATVY